MNVIINKQMTVIFTDEEKEIIKKFHRLMDAIDTEMLEEEIETVEILGNSYTKKEISEMETNVWCML